MTPIRRQLQAGAGAKAWLSEASRDPGFKMVYLLGQFKPDARSAHVDGAFRLETKSAKPRAGTGGASLRYQPQTNPK